ncbi:hypothetical protein ANTPLA_LOCUS5967 [Anthophora plagiata]
MPLLAVTGTPWNEPTKNGTIHRCERGLPYPRVGPISYYIQHRGKPSRWKPPNVHGAKERYRIFREREGKKKVVDTKFCLFTICHIVCSAVA